tara:strand:- start:675 stop:848 length:174 start_codon:yes stop_codon:yes gene_type:complete
MEIYKEIKDPVVRIQFKIMAEEIQDLKVKVDSIEKLYVSMKERYGYKIKKIEEMRGY